MTCAVAFKDKAGIVLAADKIGANTQTLSKCNYKNSKLIVTCGYAIATAGSFVLNQVIKHDLQIKRTSKRAEDFIVKEFIPNLKIKLQDRGYEIDDGDEIILVVDNKIFVLEGDLHYCEPMTNFTAIGSGADVAMGSMYVSNIEKHSAEKAVKLAIKASSTFNMGVSDKLDLIRI